MICPECEEGEMIGFTHHLACVNCNYVSETDKENSKK